MWIKMVFMSYMAITTIGQEEDGTYNYLIESMQKYHQKRVAISTKQVLPYKIGEYFTVKFTGECQELHSILSDWRSDKTYICSADVLQTRKGVYYDYTVKEVPKENE